MRRENGRGGKNGALEKTGAAENSFRFLIINRPAARNRGEPSTKEPP
jgi:hypothetical protein